MVHDPVTRLIGLSPLVNCPVWMFFVLELENDRLGSTRGIRS